MCKRLSPFIFIFFAVFYGQSEGQRCPLSLSVDISSGVRKQNGIIVHNNLSFHPKDYFLDSSGGITRGCVCNFRKCVRKCCPDGEIMLNGTCQIFGKTLDLNVYNATTLLNVPKNHFHIIHNHDCGDKGSFRLYPLDYEDDTFYVQHDGRLYKPLSMDDIHFLPPERYCLEYFYDEEMEGISVLNCFIDEEKTPNLTLSIGKFVDIVYFTRNKTFTLRTLPESWKLL